MGLCVCLSVCLSVTSRSSAKTAKHRVTKTTPHDSPGTLVFLVPKISAKFDRLSDFCTLCLSLTRLWTRCVIYTVSQKKQDTKLLAITSSTIIRFFKFFSLADSLVNLQQTHVEIYHLALNFSLHYLVKYECQKNGIILKYVLQLMINHKVL